MANDVRYLGVDQVRTDDRLVAELHASTAVVEQAEHRCGRGARKLLPDPEAQGELV